MKLYEERRKAEYKDPIFAYKLNKKRPNKLRMYDLAEEQIDVKEIRLNVDTIDYFMSAFDYEPELEFLNIYIDYELSDFDVLKNRRK